VTHRDPAAIARRRRIVGALTQIGTEVSINFGSALAGVAIPKVGSPIVVAARQLVMVLVLVPFYRPKRAELTWVRLWPALALGVVLAVMNLTFYQSVHLLGLGIAATIEFLGPLTLALVASRRVLDVVCVIIAGIGVVLLTGLEGNIDPWGIVLALIAGASWAAYILLTRRVALKLPGLEGLTVASIVSFVLIAPLAIATLSSAEFDWAVIGLLLAIGVLCSALPYSLDTFILRRITPRLFAIITSFGPATGAIFGWLVLGETFTLVQAIAIGMVCIAAAVAIATQRDHPVSQLEHSAESHS
jgi:inner membrane transporter RhtA